MKVSKEVAQSLDPIEGLGSCCMTILCVHADTGMPKGLRF